MLEKEKEIKALVSRFFEEHSKGKSAAMDVIDELFSANIVYHGGSEEIRGIKDYKNSTSESYNTFPDLHFNIDDMIVEGNKVAVRFTFTGTNKGEFMGRPSSNKKIKAWGIVIYQVVDGKIVEAWEIADNLSMMQQLGVIPAPKK